MTRIPNYEEQVQHESASAADSDTLPLMSEDGRRNADHAGEQKNWETGDRIETHDWSHKYGVSPFRRGSR